MTDIYLIASIKHTRKDDKFITFWQKNSSGYCYDLELAGTYSKEEVFDKLHYFSNHVSTIAIHIDKIIERFVKSDHYSLNHPGLVVSNNKSNWKLINKEGVECP